MTLTYYDDLAAERSEILNKSTDARVEYQYKYLKTLAKGILYQSRIPEFREIVYTKVAERFDEETNALIEKVADAYGQEKFFSEIHDEFESMGISENFADGLRAFDYTGVNGQKYYPQIYIHEFGQNKTIQPNGRTTNNDLPIVAIENLEEEADAIPGYTLDEEGQFVLVDKPITEEYAREHEVWVISLNERVFSEEDILTKSKERAQPQARVQPCATSLGTLSGNCNDGRIPGPIISTILVLLVFLMMALM